MKEAAPGTYTLAIMIGDDLDHDTTNSVFMSADNQVLEILNVMNFRRVLHLNEYLVCLSECRRRSSMQQ